METAVAYVRVSDPRQVDGTSLEVQANAVKRHAAARGYSLARVFTEEGRTAKNAQRKELRALLEFVKERRRGINVVIFAKIDRFARNAEDFLSLQRRLKVLGIRLESAGEFIEDTPVGRFNTLVQAGVAQLDNEIRAERSYAGMVEAVRSGRWVWPAPYGYRTVRKRGVKQKGIGNIEPNPSQASVVSELFAAYAAGRLGSLKEASEFLRKMGLVTSVSSTQRMLRRKAYIGIIEAFGGSFDAALPFSAIVDKPTFFAVQAKLDGRKTAPRRNEQYNEDFPLRGTVACRCGAFLASNWSRGRTKRYPYYRCMKCERSNYGRDKVEAAFESYLNSFSPRQEGIAHIGRGLASRVRIRTENLRACKTRINGEMAELATLSDSIALQNAKGIVPDATAKRQLAALESRQAMLELKLRQLENPETDNITLLQFAAGFLTGMGKSWAESNLSNKKKLQRFLFPDGIQYMGIDSFRTARTCFLEQVRDVLTVTNSRLVDQALDEPNHEFWKLLRELRDCFAEEAERPRRKGRRSS